MGLGKRQKDPPPKRKRFRYKSMQVTGTSKEISPAKHKILPLVSPYFKEMLRLCKQDTKKKYPEFVWVFCCCCCCCFIWPHPLLMEVPGPGLNPRHICDQHQTLTHCSGWGLNPHLCSNPSHYSWILFSFFFFNNGCTCSI